MSNKGRTTTLGKLLASELVAVPLWLPYEGTHGRVQNEWIEFCTRPQSPRVCSIKSIKKSVETIWRRELCDADSEVVN